MESTLPTYTYEIFFVRDLASTGRYVFLPYFECRGNFMWADVGWED